MTTLPPYCYAVDLANADREQVWEDFYTLAYAVDIGVDDPETDRAICLLRNAEGKPIGGVWGPPVEETYGFHIAVMPEYQGKGLARCLLDVMIADYCQVKLDHPEVRAEVYVINETLRDALYRRGFYVTDEFFDEPQELAAYMSEVDTLTPFIQDAKSRNAVKYQQALQTGAEIAGVAKADFEQVLLDWSSQPAGVVPSPPLPPAYLNAALNTIAALPLQENEQHLLWAQCQRHITKPVPYAQRESIKPKQQAGSLSRTLTQSMAPG